MIHIYVPQEFPALVPDRNGEGPEHPEREITLDPGYYTVLGHDARYIAVADGDMENGGVNWLVDRETLDGMDFAIGFGPGFRAGGAS